MTDYVAHNGAGLLLRRDTLVGDHVRDASTADEAGYVDVRLLERIAELELAREDVGWVREVAAFDREFSREGLRWIHRMARLSYLKNPLIQRGVEVQAYYVFGQGMSIRAQDPKVNAVIQEFLDDPANQSELTSHQAHVEKEKELRISGNVVLVFFTQASTGRVQVRSIDVDEIAAIIANPDDAQEPWYYKRQWSQVTLDLVTGNEIGHTQVAYYPDWRYRPAVRPPQIGAHPVLWENPVYHIKRGGLRGMRFGVPEVYAALDWARAVKNDLEDYATVKKSLARFSWQMQTQGGAKGVAALKNKMGTTIGTGAAAFETNPPPLPGSTAIMGAGTTLTPIHTAGAAPSPDEGRRLWLMVASALGLPETFFGEASVGAHATAKTLDRPTELKMRDRQQFWIDIWTDILEYVIDQAALAPGGTLNGTLDDDGNVTLGIDPATSEEIDRSVNVMFPDILERDVLQRVNAVVQATTLDGWPSAGTFTKQFVVRKLLEALGENDIDELVQMLAPDEKAPLFKPIDPNAPVPTAAPTPTAPADHARSTGGHPSPGATGLTKPIAEAAPVAFTVEKSVEHNAEGRVVKITERHVPIIEATHDYSSTQVELSKADADAVRTLAATIPDADLAADGREDDPHITVKYGLHADDATDVRKALAGEGPITATLGKSSIFAGGADIDYDVVTIDVTSPDLRRLNKAIAKLPHSDTHPTYRPHVTLAYVKKGLGAKYVGLDVLAGRVVTFDAVTFSGKSGKVTSIPLTTETTESQRPPHQRPAWLDAQVDEAVRAVAHWQAKHATALTRRDG